jgi:hypothetical protein
MVIGDPFLDVMLHPLVTGDLPNNGITSQKVLLVGVV